MQARSLTPLIPEDHRASAPFCAPICAAALSAGAAVPCRHPNITLARIANCNLSADASVPTWVIVAAATAISLGTYLGGWRIIRTLGHRIMKIEAPQGFSAETTSAVVILAASQAGYPLSTTHVISGGVMGAGVGKRAAEVHWGIAGQMATAWLLTLPAAALVAGGFYFVTEEIGRCANDALERAAKQGDPAAWLAPSVGWIPAPIPARGSGR